MAVNLKVAVGRNKYDLSCEEKEQEKIVELAQRLNKRVNLISITLGRLSDTVVLFIAGMSIQREIDIAKNEKMDKFYHYFTNVCKKVNNIMPAKAALNDKEERDRLFISCLTLENELYAITGGAEVNYLQNEKEIPSAEDGKNDYLKSEEYINQMSDIINFFEDLTNNTNKISSKLKDL